MCCVFSTRNGPRRHRPPAGAASQFLLNLYNCYCAPSTRHHGVTFTNLQCRASSSATFTNLQSVLLQVHHSLISSVRFYKSTIHQSPVLRLPRVLRRSILLRWSLLLHLIKCTTHQFQMLRLPRMLRRSPLLHFYKCCTIRQSPVLHLLQVLHPSSLLRFYSCYFMPRDYATRWFYIINNLATYVKLRFVNYSTASLKSKFLQLQNMLPPVDAFIILPWFSSLTSFKSTFAAPHLNY